MAQKLKELKLDTIPCGGRSRIYIIVRRDDGRRYHDLYGPWFSTKRGVALDLARRLDGAEKILGSYQPM